MPPKLEFVVYTGDATIAKKDPAHRKAVRSLVTAQHYREKRRSDVRRFEGERGVRGAGLVWGSSMEDPTWENDSREVQLSSSRRQDDLPIVEPGSAIITRSAASNTAGSGSAIDDAQINRVSDTHTAGSAIASPTPYSYLGQGRGNPFAVSPRRFSDRMAKHLYYYVNILMPQMHPSWTSSLVVQRFGCTALIVADDLILSSLSAHAATARALMTGDLVRRDQEGLGSGMGGKGFHGAELDWLFFKGRTIRGVNGRLRSGDSLDGGEGGEGGGAWGGDSTIAAIADLIMIEAFTGDLETAGAHVNGLKRILSMRQNAGPIPYSVASMTTASIIKYATLSQSAPALPFTLTFPPIPLPLPSLSQVLPNLATTLLTKYPLLSPTQSPSFIPILHDLAHMMRYTEAITSGTFPLTSDDSYHEYANYQNLSIEHRLLCYRAARFGSGGEEVVGGEDLIEYCCVLVVLLFVNTALWRGYPAGSAIIHNMVRRLKEILEVEGGVGDEGGSKGRWVGQGDVLVWVLFVGVYCSWKQAEERFFREALEKLVGFLGVGSLEEMRGILHGFLFVERVHGEVLREIWNIPM
ncbi:hypothetical protein V8E51_000047 [Hyaloscypha variabilis]